MNPNISTTGETHRDCRVRQWRYGRNHDKLGDVRKCTHGKIQVFSKPDRPTGLVGPITYFWYDLHPVWDFKRYRKAKALLEKGR